MKPFEQVSTLETTYTEISDIYDTAKIKGCPKSAFKSFLHKNITPPSSIHMTFVAQFAYRCVQCLIICFLKTKKHKKKNKNKNPKSKKSKRIKSEHRGYVVEICRELSRFSNNH